MDLAAETVNESDVVYRKRLKEAVYEPIKARKRHECLEYLSKTDYKDYFWVAIQRLETGTRRYELWELERFVTHYKTMKHYERLHHEVLKPSASCKVFIDLDGKQSEFGNIPFTEESWNTILDYFETLILDTLHEMTNMPQTKAIRWHCNRKEKFSSHLIFPHWVESTAALYFLMRKVKTLVKAEYTSFLDLNVYSPLGVKELRLPYAGKMVEADPFSLHLPVIQSPVCQGYRVLPEPVNADLLKLSLVTAFHDERYKIDMEKLNYKPGMLSLDMRSVSVGLSDGGDCTRDSVIDGFPYLTDREKDRIAEWLEERKGGYTIEEKDRDTEIKYVIRCCKETTTTTKTKDGIWCPKIGRPHNSNASSFTVRMNPGGQLHGFFTCFDCLFSWLPETTVECICFPDRFPLRLSDEDENKIRLFDLIGNRK
jgi:hypothetical protein